MTDAQVLFDLLKSQPAVAAALTFIAVVFAALLKAATVAAEILTKRWLAPAPVPPILPTGDDRTLESEGSEPLPKITSRSPWALKLPFAAALIGGSVIALILAMLSVETFQGRAADGAACTGTSLFGFENGSCVPNHFSGFEGFQ